MKELSVEEKAKRYDELLLKLQKAKVDDNVCDEMYYRVIDDIVPELKESEDEKMRKGIIRNLEYLMDRAEGFVKDELRERIAWLEKQGEQKPQGKTALEAINEEKVDNADKVEPKFKVKYAGNEYNVLEVKDIYGIEFYGIEDEPNHTDYVKAENCEIISGCAIKENGSSCSTKSTMFSTWSEEDETSIAVNNPDAYKIGFADGEAHAKEEQWKPSDEQMAVLNEVINYAANSEFQHWSNVIYTLLKSLREQLKKL